MKNPKIKDIERASIEKGGIVTKQREQLLSKAIKLDRSLFNYIKSRIMPTFTFGADGRVTNSNKNIDASRNISQLANYIDKDIDRELKRFYLGASKNSVEASSAYYKLFDPKKELMLLAKGKSDKMTRRSIVNVFNQSNVQSQVENTLSSSVLGTVTEQQMVDNVKDLVIGKEGQMGVNQRFHYQSGYDTLQANQRSIDSTFAKTLQLNYAIYTGGTIVETREFCQQRNGNVYTREEIEAWDGLDWQGKKKANVVLVDCGGYNCRHYYAWISYQLAKRLRKDIDISKYD